MKTKLTLTLIAFSVMLLSCQKEKGDIEKLYVKNEAITIGERSSGIHFNSPCFETQAGLFEVQLKRYRGQRDLTKVYSEEFINGFQELIEEQRSVINQIGFTAYIGDLETQGKITQATGDLFVYLHEKMETEEDLDLQEAEAELIKLFEPDAQEGFTDFYCFLYNITLTLYQEYYVQESEIDLRGDCKFKDFVQHILESAASGAEIGGVVNFLWEDLAGLPVWEIEVNDNLTITVPGSVIAGAIGGIVGLFTFDDDDCEDCSKVSHISIYSDGDCDLTRNIAAVGAGPDAAAYEWVVTDGPNVLNFTTFTNVLQVTQSTAAQPLEIQVRSICLDDEGNAEPTEPTEPTMIDLSTAAGSELGEVGDLDLSFFGCASTNCGGSGPTSKGIFHFFSTNVGSGHIETAFDLTPSNIGTIDYLDDTEAQVTWVNAGIATVTVTATNTCSGLSTTKSIQVTITN
ncbi:MAG: hypothetical protein NXI25_22175 [bacterium]|nr:hypothetical protein [bacterium]